MKCVYKKYNMYFWQKGKKKKINEYKIKCIGIKKIYQNVYELCVKLK